MDRGAWQATVREVTRIGHTTTVSHTPPLFSSLRPPFVHRSALHVHLYLYSCWSSPLLITDTVCRTTPRPHPRIGRNQFLPSSVGTGVRMPRCGETALGARRLLLPLPSHPRVLLRKPQIAQPSPGDSMMELTGACSWAKSTKVIMSTKRNLKDGCKNCCNGYFGEPSAAEAGWSGSCHVAHPVETNGGSCEESFRLCGFSEQL